MKLFGNSWRSLSDEDLMSKVDGGDVRAMEEIYHRYSKPLLRYFYRMLGHDKKRAEDFLHDLFIKIMLKSDQFNSKKKFSTWFYSIAHNMCKNEYRRQAFMTSVNHREKDHGYLDESVTYTLDHESFQKMLTRILMEEDEEARTIFILRHELEMTFGEIGEVLNCPEGTVKSRLFYLKKKLALELYHYKEILEK